MYPGQVSLTAPQKSLTNKVIELGIIVAVIFSIVQNFHTFLHYYFIFVLLHDDEYSQVVIMSK